MMWRMVALVAVWCLILWQLPHFINRLDPMLVLSIGGVFGLIVGRNWNRRTWLDRFVEGRAE